MKRLGTVGLAATMALVLAASIGATSASAEGPAFFRTSESPLVVEAAEYSMSNSWFTNAGSQIYCQTPSFEATVSQNDETLTSENATGGPCHKVPMEMNGCEFTFEPESTGGGSYFYGSLSIGPANCGPIKVHFINWTGCYYEVKPSKFEPKEVFYENKGTEAVRVRMEAAFDMTMGGLCAGQPAGRGYWGADWIITAQNEGELWLSETPGE